MIVDHPRNAVVPTLQSIVKTMDPCCRQTEGVVQKREVTDTKVLDQPIDLADHAFHRALSDAIPTFGAPQKAHRWGQPRVAITLTEGLRTVTTVESR